MSYDRLDPAAIADTTTRLELRIAARFSETGLRRVAAELVLLSRSARTTAEGLETPIWALRALTALLAAGAFLLLAFVIRSLSFANIESGGAFVFFQGLEASLNTLLLGGLGLLTLVRTETHIKRGRARKGLHRLRSLVHIIDMHQLTKDPAALSATYEATAASPDRPLSAPDLARYLDYCSEMLSITGKLAALYAQSFNDGEVLDAVNDIENLGSSLSRKIWQKIMIVEEMSRRDAGH